MLVDMLTLKDRAAFITGGASGIGLGTAKALLGAGARIVLADIRQDNIEDALRELVPAHGPGRVYGVQLDVSDARQFADVADHAESLVGPIDVLVNNAGVAIVGPLRSASLDDWKFALEVNLGGVINGVHSFLPRMLSRQREAHIVNTSSMSALLKMPSFAGIYATTKAAILSFSEALHDDLESDPIGVSVLIPGAVRSNNHDLARYRPPRFTASEAFAAAEHEYSQRPSSAMDGWMEPALVGERVVAAIRGNDFYIVTHSEFHEAVKTRNDAILAAMSSSDGSQIGEELKQLLKI